MKTKKKTSKPKQKFYSIDLANSEGHKKTLIFYDKFDAYEFHHKVQSVIEILGENFAWVTIPKETEGHVSNSI